MRLPTQHPPGSRPSAGAGIRAAVSRALSRFAASQSPQGPAPRADDSKPATLSQSSAPPLDLSYLWSQESDRLAVYRDADLMDAECDLCNSALNAWATTATSGSLFNPQSPAVSGAHGPGSNHHPSGPDTRAGRDDLARRGMLRIHPVRRPAGQTPSELGSQGMVSPPATRVPARIGHRSSVDVTH